MTKKIILLFTLLFGLAMLFDSCATQKNGQRKCNGKRAVKTPMGNM